MKQNTITVITVCYNVSDVIEKTMRSVLDQTYENLEYIVIDGASTDNTTETIKSVFNEYPNRKKICISEPDDGIFDAMNKGVRMASNEWLNFMNAGDCFYSNDVLEKIMSRQNDFESYNIIYSDFELRYTETLRETIIANETTGELLHQAVIYKKSLHEIHGLYSTIKPIVSSDCLFFCLIPSEQWYKTSVVIASYDMSGMSNQGNWCYRQTNCLKYVFHKKTFDELAKVIIKEYLSEILPKPIWTLYQKNIKPGIKRLFVF